MRIAFIVSHPIQYYVPIYRELGRRIRHTAQGIRPEAEAGGIRHADDCQPSLRDRPVAAGQLILTTDDSARISALKVFYTWRDAGPARDVRFEKTFAWDIPLMEGYDFEVVPNTSPEPGTHHRRGLVNPDLVERVRAWKPDVVHVTGYNYVSHGQAIKELSRAGIPVIFRGDSHLLDGRGPWWRWVIKKSILSKVYRWPKGFAYVGQANRDYYRAFGVPEEKLFPVPHTIEVGRFAEPNDELEGQALAWRRKLGIPDDHFVFLYAAKLEPRKRPMELLEAFLRADFPKTTLVFVGSGELESALREKAKGIRHTAEGQETGDRRQTEEEKPRRTGGREAGDSPKATARGSEDEREQGTGARGQAEAGSQRSDDCKLHTANSRGNVVFLEFQNQSAMPLVYRLGDALVLPSGYWETWGLAVNEAQACGRPSLVSDCVGCARDIVREGENGAVFRTDDWNDCLRAMKQMTGIDWPGKRDAIRAAAWEFDTARGVDALLRGIRQTA